MSAFVIANKPSILFKIQISTSMDEEVCICNFNILTSENVFAHYTFWYFLLHNISLTSPNASSLELFVMNYVVYFFARAFYCSKTFNWFVFSFQTLAWHIFLVFCIYFFTCITLQLASWYEYGNHDIGAKMSIFVVFPYYMKHVIYWIVYFICNEDMS